MKISNEAKVGLLVTAAFIALAVLTFQAGDFDFRTKGYTIEVLFDNVDGVGDNSPVMLNGLEVGRVEDITVKETPQEIKMQLTIWLEEGTQIHNGAKAYVKNMGFMGEKYVGLTSGIPTEPYLNPGAVIGGSEPADLDRILIDAQTVVEEIKSMSLVVNERLQKNKDEIDRIFLNLDETMVHVNSIAANLDERVNANAAHIDDIVLNLRSTTENLDLFSYDVKENPWKLLYRPKDHKKKNDKEMKQLKDE